MEEPQNMITRRVRIFFIKKDEKTYPILEVIDRNLMVASAKLTLRQALMLEKTLAKFISYVLRKKITGYRVNNDDDLKTLKAMEKTIDALDVLVKNIEQLMTGLYRDRRVYAHLPYNHS